MKTFFFLTFLSFLALTSNAQILTNPITARAYLASNTTWTQAEFNAYNNQPGMYQVKFPSDSTQSTSMILSYPSLQPVNIYWANGVWNSDTAAAITSNFNTLLMVTGISHTIAAQIPGATTSSVTFTWNSIPGVTQYRFRIRPVGGTWNVSTITGTSRTISLVPNTTYEVVLRVFISSTVQGSYNEQVYTFTTPAFIPLPPCNPPTKSAQIVGNQLIISWQPAPLATSYFVQMRQIGALTWGGASSSNTQITFPIDSTKAYEYSVRSNCTGASTAISVFGKIDTITKAVCTAPTNLYNVGNTFYWTLPQYGQLSHIELRQVGSQNWGGASTSGNSFTNPILWGQFEWRVRTRCYGTTNSGWTNWAYGLTGFIPKPNIFEQLSTELAYPNPANDQVNLKGEIVLRDLTGRVIATGNDILDVSQIADGLYFVNEQKLIIKH